MKNFDLSLYLVLDPILCADFGMVETARAAVAGGATIVQLRDKHASTAAMIDTGLALKRALAGSKARLIVNDDVEAAIAIGADGLHIGQEDLDADTARRMIGPEMILGLSVETEALASAVDAEIVDYVGVGPVLPRRPSPTTSSRSALTALPASSGSARFLSSPSAVSRPNTQPMSCRPERTDWPSSRQSAGRPIP